MKSTPSYRLACGCLNTHTQIFHLLILSSPDTQLHMASDYILVLHHVSCSISEALEKTVRLLSQALALKSTVLELYSDTPADGVNGVRCNGKNSNLVLIIYYCENTFFFNLNYCTFTTKPHMNRTHFRSPQLFKIIREL